MINCVANSKSTDKSAVCWTFRKKKIAHENDLSDLTMRCDEFEKLKCQIETWVLACVGTNIDIHLHLSIGNSKNPLADYILNMKISYILPMLDG